MLGARTYRCLGSPGTIHVNAIRRDCLVAAIFPSAYGSAMRGVTGKSSAVQRSQAANLDRFRIPKFDLEISGHLQCDGNLAQPHSFPDVAAECGNYRGVSDLDALALQLRGKCQFPLLTMDLVGPVQGTP